MAIYIWNWFNQGFKRIMINLICAKIGEKNMFHIVQLKLRIHLQNALLQPNGCFATSIDGPYILHRE